MTVYQRRLRAVFLCLQGASVLAFFAALCLLWFAMPAKVQAQPMPGCLPIADVVLQLRQSLPEGTAVDHLGAARAETYQTALPSPPTVFDDAMLLESSTGAGMVVEVIDGWLCPTSRAYEVPPSIHKVATQSIIW